MESADEVAKELANPTNALGRLSFLLDYVQYDGDLPGASSQGSTVLLIQPSLPYPLENGMNLFARPAIPILLDQPAFTGTGFTDEGVELGDISFDLGYGELVSATAARLAFGRLTPMVFLAAIEEFLAERGA